MAKYESQAAKLIREEVIPVLKDHGEQLQRVEGILIDAGLDNGTADAARHYMKKAIARGLEGEHKQAVARQFFAAYFGWLKPSWRRATKWVLGFFGGFSTVYWGLYALRSAPGMVNETLRHLHR